MQMVFLFLIKDTEASKDHLISEWQSENVVQICLSVHDLMIWKWSVSVPIPISVVVPLSSVLYPRSKEFIIYGSSTHFSYWKFQAKTLSIKTMAVTRVGWTDNHLKKVMFFTPGWVPSAEWEMKISCYLSTFYVEE